ncbi:ATP-binding protein [Streptomyces californicus]|uniref:ATP-binding protein n=1 Tax=Streptomyces californicus TaxID=67351 RepID=UPI00367C60AC
MTTTRPNALPPEQSAGPPAVPPRLICEAVPESVRAVRRYVREAVAYQEPGVPPETLDTVELLASELATNAVRYGTEPGDSLQVVVDAGPGKCRIEVHDTRRKRPRIRPPSNERSRGRGLHLVDLLANSWGTADREFGKIVWMVVTW